MSEEKINKSPSKEEGEEELADLLDSALKDFTKDEENDNKKAEEAIELSLASEVSQTEWSDEFIKQAAEQFEANMVNMLKDSGANDITADQVQQSFQRMAAAAATVVSNSAEAVNESEFTASITDALRGLTEGAENLQSPFSGNDIMNMFTQTEGDQNAFMPFMQGMMQSLLSKEVLYPSLKDISNKYPAWLEANSNSLSKEDKQKYKKQYELMIEVCEQLEKESDNDTVEHKRVQFEKVLVLMQKLQDFGQPPTELVGELGPPIPFDVQGNPNLNQCCTM
ncbi:hypothetical protein FQA39_LY14235 [Lamprigera yunnana]|nr:hypothetical protein FQA39_LY14235 [Lamprigera yunnana]